jgi:type IV pilus biogenesis protein CpaD/CtpE
MKLVYTLVLLVVAIALAGCSAQAREESTAPPLPDDYTLSQAVAMVDQIDLLTDQVESGKTALAAKTLDGVDAKMKAFSTSTIPETMPGYYQALLDWRAAMDRVFTSSSGVLAERAYEDMSEAYGRARSELDATLDAAGK